MKNNSKWQVKRIRLTVNTLAGHGGCDNLRMLKGIVTLINISILVLNVYLGTLEVKHTYDRKKLAELHSTWETVTVWEKSTEELPNGNYKVTFDFNGKEMYVTDYIYSSKPIKLDVKIDSDGTEAISRWERPEHIDYALAIGGICIRAFYSLIAILGVYSIYSKYIKRVS